MESSGDDQIVQEFLIESYESLDALDRELVTLESNPTDAKALASIFRMIHTIKGTCGFLGFGKLEKVAHVGENLLSRLRDGELRLTPEMTTALLRTGDAIRQMLRSIEARGNEGERNDLELIDLLTRLQQVASLSISPPSSGSSAPQTPVMQCAAVTVVPAIAGPTGHENGWQCPNDSAPAIASGDIHAEPVNPVASNPEAVGGATGKSQASESTIRVDVGLLDKLMNLVGELVLARNQILQFANSASHNGPTTLLATSQRLNLITTELQEGVMKTRMQPISRRCYCLRQTSAHRNGRLRN